MQQSIYVGLDLGSSRCHQTVINADGALVRSRVIPTSEQHLRSAFTALGEHVRVHLESGELADWVSSLIKPLVAEVVVSHSRNVSVDWQRFTEGRCGRCPQTCRTAAAQSDASGRLAKPLMTVASSNNW